MPKKSTKEWPPVPVGEDGSTPGRRIRAVRGHRGIMQKELADAAEVSVTHLCAIERDQQPVEVMKVKTLVRLCDVLGAPLDYVVKGRGPSTVAGAS